MALFIKKYQSNNEKNGTYGKWYGRAAMLGTVDVENLAEQIGQMCTVNRADIVAVLSALGVVVKDNLQKSYRVELPYLGVLKLAVSTRGEAKEEDFNVRSSVKAVRVRFVPVAKADNGRYVRELLRGVKLSELPKYGTVADADGTDPDSGDTGGSGNSGSGDGGTTGGGSTVEDRP